MAALVTWPGTLPTIVPVGTLQRFSRNTIRTEVDQGIAKMRRRFTSSVQQFDVPMILTDAQLDTLYDFFHNETSGSPGGTAEGSLPFFYDNPRTGSTEEFRFLSPPEVQRSDNGIVHRVTLKLESVPA